MCFFRFQYFPPFRSSLFSSLFLCKEVSSFWLQLSLAPCSPFLSYLIHSKTSFFFPLLYVSLKVLLLFSFPSMLAPSFTRSFRCSGLLPFVLCFPSLPLFTSPCSLLTTVSPFPLVTLLLSIQHCTHFSAHFSTFFPSQGDDQSLSTHFLTPWGLVGNFSLFLEDPKKGVSGELVGSSLYCPGPRGRIKTCDLLRKFLL